MPKFLYTLVSLAVLGTASAQADARLQQLATANVIMPHGISRHAFTFKAPVTADPIIFSLGICKQGLKANMYVLPVNGQAYVQAKDLGLGEFTHGAGAFSVVQVSMINPFPETVGCRMTLFISSVGTTPPQPPEPTTPVQVDPIGFKREMAHKNLHAVMNATAAMEKLLAKQEGLEEMLESIGTTRTRALILDRAFEKTASYVQLETLYRKWETSWIAFTKASATYSETYSEELSKAWTKLDAATWELATSFNFQDPI